MPTSFYHYAFIQELANEYLRQPNHGNFALMVSELEVAHLIGLELPAGGADLGACPWPNVPNLDGVEQLPSENIEELSFYSENVGKPTWHACAGSYVAGGSRFQQPLPPLSRNDENVLHAIGAIASRLIGQLIQARLDGQRVTLSEDLSGEGRGANVPIDAPVDVNKAVLLVSPKNFTVAELREGLRQIHIRYHEPAHVAALKAAGFTAADLIVAGYTEGEIAQADAFTLNEIYDGLASAIRTGEVTFGQLVSAPPAGGGYALAHIQNVLRALCADNRPAQNIAGQSLHSGGDHAIPHTTDDDIQSFLESGFKITDLVAAGYDDRHVIHALQHSLERLPAYEREQETFFTFLARLIQHQECRRDVLVTMGCTSAEICCALQKIHRSGVNAAEGGQILARYNQPADVYSMIKRGFTQDGLAKAGYSSTEIRNGIVEYIKQEVIIEDAAGLAANAVVVKTGKHETLRALGFVDNKLHLLAALRSIASGAPGHRDRLPQNLDDAQRHVNGEIAHHDVRYLIKAGFSQAELKSAGYGNAAIQNGIWSYIEHDITVDSPTGNGKVLNKLGYSATNIVAALSKFSNRHVERNVSDDTQKLLRQSISKKYLLLANYSLEVINPVVQAVIREGYSYARLNEELEVAPEELAQQAREISGATSQDRQAPTSAGLVPEEFWGEAVGTLLLDRTRALNAITLPPLDYPIENAEQANLWLSQPPQTGLPISRYIKADLATKLDRLAELLLHLPLELQRQLLDQHDKFVAAGLNLQQALADIWLAKADGDMCNNVARKRNQVLQDMVKRDERRKLIYIGILIGWILALILSFIKSMVDDWLLAPIAEVLFVGVVGSAILYVTTPIFRKIHLWLSKKLARNEFNQKLQNGSFAREIATRQDSLLSQRSKEFVRARGMLHLGAAANFADEDHPATSRVTTEILHRTWQSSNRHYVFDHIMQRVAGVPWENGRPALSGNLADARRLLYLLWHRPENWHVQNLAWMQSDKTAAAQRGRVMAQLLANVKAAGIIHQEGNPPIQINTRPFAYAMTLMILGRTLNAIREAPGSAGERMQFFREMLATNDGQELLLFMANDKAGLKRALAEVWEVRSVDEAATDENRRDACLNATRLLSDGLSLRNSTRNRAAIAEVVEVYNQFLAEKDVAPVPFVSGFATYGEDAVVAADEALQPSSSESAKQPTRSPNIRGLKSREKAQTSSSSTPTTSSPSIQKGEERSPLLGSKGKQAVSSSSSKLRRASAPIAELSQPSLIELGGDDESRERALDYLFWRSQEKRHKFHKVTPIVYESDTGSQTEAELAKHERFGRRILKATTKIKREPNLNAFYTHLCLKLQSVAIGSMAVASGKVVPTKGVAGKAAIGVEFAGDMFHLFLPHDMGKFVEVGLKWTVEKPLEALDEKRQENAAEKMSHLFGLLQTMPNLIAEIAIRLTNCYAPQLRQLAIAAEDGWVVNVKEKLFKREPMQPAQKFAEFCFILMLSALESGLVDEHRPLADQLVNLVTIRPVTHGLPELYAKLHVDKVKTNEGEEWRVDEICTKCGVKLGSGAQYAGGETEPNKYGYCMGTEGMVSARGLALVEYELQVVTDKTEKIEAQASTSASAAASSAYGAKEDSGTDLDTDAEADAVEEPPLARKVKQPLVQEVVSVESHAALPAKTDSLLSSNSAVFFNGSDKVAQQPQAIIATPPEPHVGASSRY